MINPIDILGLEQGPHEPVIKTKDRIYPKEEILGQASALVRRLNEAKACKGDSIVVSLDSGPHFLSALIGCWCIGATPVLLDPLVRQELERVVRMTGSKIVVRGQSNDNSSFCTHVIVPDESSAAPIDALMIEDSAPILKLFTSGTTGEPTLVSKTFEQLDVEVRFLSNLFNMPKRVATMAPWCHIFGLILSCFLPIRSKGYCDLSAGISTKKILSLAAKGAVDLIVVVPAIIQVMVRNLEADPLLKALPMCSFVTSGAPLYSSLRSRFAELIGGARIADLYGSTEAGGVAYRYDDGPWLVQPHVESRITAEGFLEVRSPSVSIKTPDGFLRIGDIARPEGKGFVLESRADDIVKIGGRRTSLVEIAKTIEECPGVAFAVCLAAEIRGATRIAAFVELRSAGIEPEYIRSFVKSRLADHKVPRAVRIVDNLPRTPAGKIDIRRLRDTIENA